MSCAAFSPGTSLGFKVPSNENCYQAGRTCSLNKMSAELNGPRQRENRPAFDLSVYLVTDRARCRSGSVEQVVEAALRGTEDTCGATIIQLRDKAVPHASSVELGMKLRQLCRRSSIPFIVNDSVELAQELNADGVHLGQEDGAARSARETLGPRAIIGLSVGNVAEAKIALESDVDYIGVGPVFRTRSKSDAGEPIGTDGLRDIVDFVGGKLPIVAIGGVYKESAANCVHSGADGVAVISAIMAATDPAAAATALWREVDVAKKTISK